MGFYEDDRIRRKNKLASRQVEPSYTMKLEDGLTFGDVAGVLSDFFEVSKSGNTIILSEKQDGSKD